MTKYASIDGFQIFIPSKKFCTDNAGMIGVVGYYFLKKGVTTDLSISAIPDWTL
jgi:tRNA A37 threonylcarbamoyltransferase TsaD